ncbi:cAMP receptor protein [Planctomycetes bacterium Pan216]|uniref:cAMP receptor protein n=1 Tax=Kolteria novifilia TaxID=2527975 RepID=A0A518BBZ7_9BACT|nr:cAMP receptor protein [Planctomycetes bacterium Pan216]
MERFWFLKNSQLFEGLSDDECSKLEARSSFRRFKTRETVYFPGDAGGHVLLLLDGRIKIKTITPDGKEAILAFVEPGEIFGELALLSESERTEYAEANLASSVIAVPRDAMLEIMNSHPATSLRVTKFMGLKQQRIENRMKNLLFRSFRDRVIYLLAELAQRYGRWVGETQLDLGIKLSHQEIASLIGATRETVTIALGDLQSEGLVTVKRKQIAVTNVNALFALLDQPMPMPPRPRDSSPHIRLQTGGR